MPSLSLEILGLFSARQYFAPEIRLFAKSNRIGVLIAVACALFLGLPAMRASSENLLLEMTTALLHGMSIGALSDLRKIGRPHLKAPSLDGVDDSGMSAPLVRMLPVNCNRC